MQVTERQALIHKRLSEAFPQAEIHIVDDSQKHQGHVGAESGAGHFKVSIISNVFDRKSRLERHRMVYEALAGLIGPEIHAVQISAKTPQEFRERSC